VVAKAEGTQWAALVSLDEAERVRAMQEQLDSVLALEEEERLVAVEDMVRAEYLLADPELRTFTASRLRVWARIGSRDMEAARTIARLYDAVFDRLPADLAMRRASMVQSVARADISAQELETLFEVIPSILRQVPRQRLSGFTSEKPVRKAAWWKVWARG
jgi:hypothetical protein